MEPVSLVLSERKLAANRANARKSTGPRTPVGKCRSSMNSLKHGRYAQRARAIAQELGEDPLENQAMVEELIEAYRPANAAERMLVEDIAALRLQRRRSDRAQAGRQACAAEKLELERRRRQLEMRRNAPPEAFAALATLGICRAPDSAGKFKLMREYLQAVLDSIETRQFSRSAADMLRTIYGKAPDKRALELVVAYEKLVESPPAKTGFDAGLEILLAELQQEQRTVAEELEIYKAEQMDVSAALQDASLAPEGNGWKLLIRQANSIDRCLDRK
ncbi:MAG: hypothetical protein ACM3NO_11675, partial [Deltaproteobacteria bacterium]